MIIKLFLPPTQNWLLIAEQLDDPTDWDRFLPSHTTASQRWQFDSQVKRLASGKMRVALSKDLLKRGTSAFQYDWEADETDILLHAIEVSDQLGCDLLLDAAPGEKASATDNKNDPSPLRAA